MNALRVVGIILVCLLPAASTEAQSYSQTPIGGYFHLSFESMTVRHDRGLVTGLGFGMVFNHRQSVGLAGYGLWSSTIRTTTLQIGAANARFHIVWGGLEGSLVLLQVRPFRLTLEAFAGVGNVQLPTTAFNQLVKDIEERRGTSGPTPEDKDQFYLLRPSLVAQWFPERWLVLSLFCSYKLVSGVSYFTMTNSDLAGLDVGVRAAIGTF